MKTYKVLMLMLQFIPALCIQYETFSTITPNHSIQVNQTLVSSAGTFEAGFFNFANSQLQYFGIWYKTISPRIYVWIANRDSPIQNSTPILKLTYQGTLTIVDDSSPKIIIWSSNASTIAAKPVLSLLDSGNLVVKDGKRIMWESFDYPGDTLLPGMKLKTNLLNGPYKSLTSWKSVIQRLVWSDSRKDWDIISTRPLDLCAYYSSCGDNSICNIINSQRICECLEGFVPKYYEKWNSVDWSGGCVRRVRLNCSGDGFLKHLRVEWPDTSSSWLYKSLNLEECEKKCLKNCSCSAYAILDVNSGCLLWFGNIRDLKTYIDQGQDIFIRLAASELDHGRNRRSFNKLKLAGALVGIILFIMVLGLATFTYIKRKKLAKPGMLKIFYRKHKRDKEDVQLSTIFDFSTISNATNHFSDDNKIGQGGFGPVYKGILEDGLEIAVKRLSEKSAQGEEQFKNEVILMAKLQHRNLVKLLGCSIYQNEKLLIYELMPNRSLNYFIFDSTRKKQLDLIKRFQIIDGIGRDFGLARIFIGDQDESNTNRLMGTYGYMPPEYAVRGCFSIKSDVFSFGVIVLEIISGRRIRNFYDPHHHHLNLLGHAWRLWSEEKAQELIDELFHGTIIPSEILRCIHVGLLCVQQIPEHRPNMSSVVLMLNSEKLLPEPSQPGFYTETARHPIQVESSPRSCEDCSQNEASMSKLEAR
ncbi:G-type lectin S-receptor serine/threonine-protein kinase [Trifolium repens]|nr:G-type lectin S-receptor serine/threonine-protein kinase [Trifolium repens]